MLRWIVSYLEAKRNSVVAKLARGRVLDVGCGSNILVRLVGNGVGVDVYPWPGVDILIQDASMLPFKDGCFDTITFVASLNHIPNRIEALREAARVMTPDGQILVTMIGPTLSRIWHRLIKRYDMDQTERGMAPGETWGLTEEQIRRLASEAGLRVEAVVPFELGLNRVYVIRRQT
jgi:ubiquinone/menaquinone biosynthesis C-methylase UbiE